MFGLGAMGSSMGQLLGGSSQSQYKPAQPLGSYRSNSIFGSKPAPRYQPSYAPSTQTSTQPEQFNRDQRALVNRRPNLQQYRPQYGGYQNYRQPQYNPYQGQRYRPQQGGYQRPQGYGQPQYGQRYGGYQSPYQGRFSAMNQMRGYDQGMRNYYSQRADQNRLNQLRYDQYARQRQGQSGGGGGGSSDMIKNFAMPGRSLLKKLS